MVLRLRFYHVMEKVILIAPHKVNYRANVFALKEFGVEYLVSTAAVGSLKKELKPCDFVIADQLIDRSFKRSTTFFEDGIVAHVGFADPFCKTLSDIAFEVAKDEGVRCSSWIVYLYGGSAVFNPS